MNWYLEVLQQYTNFTGRARRKEYWMFALFNILISIVAIILDNIFGTTIDGTPYGLIYVLYVLAIFLPSLGVCVRRLHDVGKSGWMLLISLIPLVGSIWLIVLMTTEGDPGENQYGSNPKGQQSDASNDAVNQDNSDTIILIVVIWMFINKSFWTFLNLFGSDFYSLPSFVVIQKSIGLVWSIIPIVLAVSVKDTSKRNLLFVLGGIYALYSLYEVIFN